MRSHLFVAPQFFSSKNNTAAISFFLQFPIKYFQLSQHNSALYCVHSTNTDFCMQISVFLCILFRCITCYFIVVVNMAPHLHNQEVLGKNLCTSSFFLPCWANLRGIFILLKTAMAL